MGTAFQDLTSDSRLVAYIPSRLLPPEPVCEVQVVHFQWFPHWRRKVLKLLKVKVYRVKRTRERKELQREILARARDGREGIVARDSGEAVLAMRHAGELRTSSARAQAAGAPGWRLGAQARGKQPAFAD